jgi:hypothetical protein
MDSRFNKNKRQVISEAEEMGISKGTQVAKILKVITKTTQVMESQKDAEVPSSPR